MRFGIFYEHQLPRPWGDDGEQRLIQDALEQVELADRVGFDSVWEVEHHFLEEYSHSSASERLPRPPPRSARSASAWASGSSPLPPGYQHPARVAETVAMLDLVSDGRVEFGTGETSSGAELEGFGVDRETKRAQWEEALDVVTRMMVEEPFAGDDGRFVTMPPRNVVPKPVQKPHPPLWVACSRRETIRLAAEKGIGALSFSFVEPEEAQGVGRRVPRDHRERALRARRLRGQPAGRVRAADDVRTRRGAGDRARDRRRALLRLLARALLRLRRPPPGPHEHLRGVPRAAATSVGFARSIITADAGAARRARSCSRASARCAARSARPSRCATCAGATRRPASTSSSSSCRPGATATSTSASRSSCSPPRSCPSSPQRADAADARRGRALRAGDRGGAARAASRRASPTPTTRSRPIASGPPPAASRRARAVATARTRRRGLQALLAEQGERRVHGASSGAPTIAAWSAPRARAPGLKRALRRDGAGLRARQGGGLQRRPPVRPAARRTASVVSWTVTARARARERPARAPRARPALTLKLGVADFVRLAGGDLDPGKALLTGRMDMEGDLAIAARLGEMFGQPAGRSEAMVVPRYDDGGFAALPAHGGAAAAAWGRAASRSTACRRARSASSSCCSTPSAGASSLATATTRCCGASTPSRP